MNTIHKGNTRGTTQTDWLTSFHTFSFGEYYNPSMMEFASLRVINEDYILPNSGFPMHQHRDMEIVTYVISGALSHQDSLGNGSTIIPGEIQRMSAGTGIRHSEFNHSPIEEVHLLQIWIFPETTGMAPGYEQKKIARSRNTLILIASQSGSENAVRINQKLCLYAAYLDMGTRMEHRLSQKKAWLQLIKGHLEVNNLSISPGDGLAVTDSELLTIRCVQENAEFLLFDFIG